MCVCGCTASWNSSRSPWLIVECPSCVYPCTNTVFQRCMCSVLSCNYLVISCNYLVIGTGVCRIVIGVVMYPHANAHVKGNPRMINEIGASTIHYANCRKAIQRKCRKVLNQKLCSAQPCLSRYSTRILVCTSKQSYFLSFRAIHEACVRS